MQIFLKNRFKVAAALTGQCFTLLFALLLYFDFPAISKIYDALENGIYDFQMRRINKPPKENPIAIIDVDDESLKELGTWPWNRDQLALITQKLIDRGATTVAWDFVFPNPQKNIIEEVAASLPEKMQPELEEIKPKYDYDAIFAKKLASINSIIGFILTLQKEAPTGILPPALFKLSPNEGPSSFIPDMQSYIGNAAVLQNAAKNGAFINATPDSDGVNRKAPLLLRIGEQVYPSLALEAARIYLLSNASLIIEKYRDAEVLEGIKLDQTTVPTTPSGQILIPYRGRSFSFPIFPAIDLLKDQVPKEKIATKLVFIGTSAAGMGDLISTSISPLSPGVTILATLSLGIIDHYLPYKPTWGQGVTLLLLIALGTFASWFFPFVGPLKKTVVFLCVFAAIVFVHFEIWNRMEIIFSFSPPLTVFTLLYLAYILFGYVSETHQKTVIKSLFGQYVPKERIEEILEKKALALEENAKELTVLFSDIRNFTAMSEKMTASELKKFLNVYLSPMTEIIFKHKGTVDKYVGDMVVAFWGAPLPDADHAVDAVASALEMQKKIEEMNKTLTPAIKVGIGINTGVMNVGDMGSEYRRAYTVLGDAVNFGSRLEELTKYYKIYTLAGEETAKQAKDFSFRKLDRVRVKGKEKFLEIYEPVARSSDCTPEQLRLIKKNGEALEAYFHQDWKTAETLFRQISTEDPSHQTYCELFLERIEAYKKTPPETNWDGATTFLTK